MAGAVKYPPANSTIQYWAAKFVGTRTTPNCLLLHSTEGTGWPGYSDGAVAPHLTAMPDFQNKRVIWRQHYPLNRSSRALENHVGGVETNTLNVVQIELVGTCDPATHKKWGSTPHIYMPEAPDWYVQGIADFASWFHDEWPKFNIRDGAPRGWGAYPASYGASKYRMSNSEWLNFYGICGHQHAPENSHGDPGAFPIARLVALATGSTSPEPDPVQDPVPDPLDVLDPANYPDAEHPTRNTTGPQITWLGERLVVHGFDKHYQSGPGPNWSDADRENVRDFQLDQGWTGDGADGYPGPATLRRLASEPKPPTEPAAQVISVSQNFAGNNAYGIKTAAARIARYVAARKNEPVDVINAQECTVASTVRPRLDSGLGPLGYGRVNGGKGRYEYRNGNTVKTITHGLITTPSSTWYQLDDKQAAYGVYEHIASGIRFMDVSLHLESDGGAVPDQKRVEQAKYIAGKALALATANGVDHRNVLLTGDTNSEGMVLAALVALGWRNCAAGTDLENEYTFMGWDGRSRKRFDYALVRQDALDAKVVAIAHDTDISDHAGLRIVRTLTA